MAFTHSTNKKNDQRKRQRCQFAQPTGHRVDDTNVRAVARKLRFADTSNRLASSSISCQGQCASNARLCANNRANEAGGKGQRGQSAHANTRRCVEHQPDSSNAKCAQQPRWQTSGG